MVISFDIFNTHLFQNLFTHVIEEGTLTLLALLPMQYLVLARGFIYFHSDGLPIECE